MTTPTPHDVAIATHALLADLEPARMMRHEDAQIERFPSRCAEVARALQGLGAEHSGVHEIAARLIDASSRSGDRASFSELRDELAPHYEAWAQVLRKQGVRAPRLRPSNIVRNLFHVASALSGVAVVEFLPQWTGLGFTAVVVLAWSFAGFAWSMELGRRTFEHVNAFLMAVFSPVAHPHEEHHINSATWYATALALLTLTGSPLVCTIALAVLGIADPAAAIVGKRWGRTRFENGRSLEGTATFVLAGTLAAMFFTRTMHSEVDFLTALALCLAAAALAGWTELRVDDVDDNLSIPVTAGAAAWAMGLLLWAPVY